MLTDPKGESILPTINQATPDVCNDIELPQIMFSEVMGVFERLRAPSSGQADTREWFGASLDPRASTKPGE